MTKTATGVTHIQFWNRIRYLIVLLVVVHHGACAYTKIVPWWYSNSGQTAFLFDLTVITFDMFIMPVLFFVSGYFAPPSLLRSGPGAFFRSKVRRLFLPLAFLTVFYVPIINFISSVAWGRNTSGDFFAYWKHVLLSFTPFCWRVFDSVESSIPYVDDMTPNYLWYIALLFLFMLLFLGMELLGASAGKRGATRGATREPQSGKAMLAVLGVSCVLMSVAMAWINLYMPLGVWAQASSFLVLQPIRLPLYGGMFFLGVYANRHGWFLRRPLPGALWCWIVVMVLAEVGFIYWFLNRQQFFGIFGWMLFAVGTRVVFALSMTVILTTLGYRYWNTSSGLHRMLSRTSYDLYLLHLPLLVALQYGLRSVEVSIYLKFALAVIVTAPVCIFASQLSQKWPSWLKGAAMLVVFGLVGICS